MMKIVRILVIVLFGLTVAFQFLGAIGSSCVALGAEKYDSMAALAPVKWLYQLLAVVTLAAALYGGKVIFSLARGKPKAYFQALGVLLITLLTAAVQMFTSRALRGASQPNDMRVYVTLFTLVIFLLLRLPGVWAKTGFEGGQSGSGAAGGAALIFAGALALTVHLWAGPTHLMDGINYADVWRLPMTLGGWALVAAGLALLAAERRLSQAVLPA
jgi:hypothetical protein